MKKIKLIIWDLDDTFWQGTLSEEEIIPIEENVQLVIKLSKRGIVSSICSKNDFEEAMNQLNALKIDNYFVFESIDWSSKGPRIKNIVQDMNLREENVLFIDDNELNLNEAKYFCPNIHILLPIKKELENLYRLANTLGKDDGQLTRLQNYKVLEEKTVAEKLAVSNTDFLFDCNIQIQIHSERKDIETHIRRVYELIGRTNQLNFTKKRSTFEALQGQLKEENIEMGYVTAQDNFGDYGIVGLYALDTKINELVHFLFSCRSMGMGIENYVYQQLNEPKLITIEPVAYHVDKNKKSPWINQSTNKIRNERQDIQHAATEKTILIKGSCEIEWVIDLLSTDAPFSKEIGHLNTKTGADITSFNHSTNVYNSFYLTSAQKECLGKEVPLWDDELVSTDMNKNNYDIVFLSGFLDQWEGVYQRKGTGEKIALGIEKIDYTSRKMLEEQIRKTQKEDNQKYIQQQRKKIDGFTNKYVYVGKVSAVEAADNFKKIVKKVPKETLVVIMLPSDFQVTSYGENRRRQGEERGLYNQAIWQALKGYKNVRYINFSTFTHSESDFLETQDHFTKKIYYEVALEMQKIINETVNHQVNRISAEEFRQKKFRNSYSTMNALGLLKPLIKSKNFIQSKK
ncbi:HAD-IIIC family phosphatase [Enterococcus phoeniculicola]|nr:HAD-IIIC family phosphatase [Enterococcus phoeniculicola]